MALTGRECEPFYDSEPRFETPASRGGQNLEHPLNIFLADIKMRRHADPALPRRRQDPIALQVRYNRAAICGTMTEADDARPRLSRRFQHQLISFAAEACRKLLR